MTKLDDSGAEYVLGVITTGFKDVHRKMRDVIRDLDRESVNWKPNPEANSIAVLVTHTLSSEREMLAAVRGIKIPRDRESEFATAADPAALQSMLDEADAWLDEQTSAMSAADLSAARPRGDNPSRPALEWLVTNYGHAREHLAQMELTRQLRGGQG